MTASLDRWQACVPVLTRISCWIIKRRFPFGDWTLQNLTARSGASTSGFHRQSTCPQTRDLERNAFPEVINMLLTFTSYCQPFLTTPQWFPKNSKYVSQANWTKLVCQIFQFTCLLNFNSMCAILIPFGAQIKKSIPIPMLPSIQ